MGKVWSWIEGKKTIAGGLLVMLAALAGIWYQKLDPVTALTVFGAGMSIAGWGDKANRHQAELLIALQGLAQVGALTQAGEPGQTIKSAEATAEQLSPSILQMVTAMNKAVLHDGATVNVLNTANDGSHAG